MKDFDKIKGKQQIHLLFFFYPEAGKRDTKKKFPKPFERDEGRQGDHERGAGDGARYDDSHKSTSGSRRSDELNSSQGNLTNVKIETFFHVLVTVSLQDMRVPRVRGRVVNLRSKVPTDFYQKQQKLTPVINNGHE